MRAWLERHIKRGTARRTTGLRQRDRLGMGTAARLRPASADDDAILNHHGADGGIGMRAPQAAPAKRQRERHETPVSRFRFRIALPRMLAGEDHLRNKAIRASSSPESSPSTASKSLASRKLR